MPRTYSITFQPGYEIVHVIAKNFNPVNRAEFNPEVENAPCNRPLSAELFESISQWQTMWLGTKWREMQMILSIMLLLSSFRNVCGENT
jgi:hypothetical protein